MWIVGNSWRCALLPSKGFARFTLGAALLVFAGMLRIRAIDYYKAQFFTKANPYMSFYAEDGYLVLARSTESIDPNCPEPEVLAADLIPEHCPWNDNFRDAPGMEAWLPWFDNGRVAPHAFFIQSGPPWKFIYNASWVSIPIFWFAILGAALCLIKTGVITRNRHDPGHCSQCDYDLRATPERCPECGTVVCPPGNMPTPDPEKGRIERGE
jgi:hypothetical protein